VIRELCPLARKGEKLRRKRIGEDMSFQPSTDKRYRGILTADQTIRTETDGLCMYILTDIKNGEN